jgi:GRAS domain family
MIDDNNKRSARTIAALADPLPNTPTQKEMEAVVNRSVRPSAQRMRGCAYRALLDETPLAQFGDRAAVATIMHGLQGARSLEILDLGFDDGRVWESLIVRLGRLPTVPTLFISAIRDTGSDHDSVQRDAEFRLKAAAAAHHVPLDLSFSTIAPVNWPGPFAKRGHRLFVNAGFSLHHIPDDGFDDASARQQVLQRVRALHPDLLFVAEPDFGPFAERRGGFGEAQDPAQMVVDAIEDMTPRPLFDDKTPTPIASYELILRGEKVPGTRPEMADRLENWRRRIGRASFVPLDITPLRGAIVGDMKLPVRAVIAPDGRALRLCWKGKALVNVSAWLPA